MKSSVDKLSVLNRRLNVELPPEVVKGAFDKVFRDLQKKANLKGFRKGKAPLNLIRSMYMDLAKQDVTEKLLINHFGEALREHELNPVASPEFEFEDPSELTGFSFSAIFEVRPEIKLSSYQNLELKKESFSLDDNRIEQVLNNIRNSRSTTEDIEPERPAEKGDIAVIDFEGFVDGAPIEGGKGADHPLELGSNQFIEGFEDGVIGMKAGETKTLHLKFSESYHAKDLNGKNVDFKVTLKKLQKKVLPELNDELLKSIGGPSSVEELKKNIRENIEESEKKRIEGDLKNSLFKKLVELNPIEIPASLVKKQKEMLIEDYKQKNTEEGWDLAQIEEFIKKFDEYFDKKAKEIIQASFLIDEIAKKHDLSCQPEDLDKKFADYAQMTGIPEARIREHYSKPELEDRLVYSIIEEKVVQFLLESAKITEVSKEQLIQNND